MAPEKIRAELITLNEASIINCNSNRYRSFLGRLIRVQQSGKINAGPLISPCLTTASLIQGTIAIHRQGYKRKEFGLGLLELGNT